MKEKSFYKLEPNGVKLYIKLTPKASHAAIVGIVSLEDEKEYLALRVCHPPEKGKANQELIQFLAKFLKIKKSAVSLEQGKTARYKTIFIETLTPKTLIDKICSPNYALKV